MAEHNDSPRTTFLPPKAGSNIPQSSAKLNSKLAEVISFQAPRFQDHSKSVKFQVSDYTKERIITFLPPKDKEHKKPLSQGSLGLRSVTSFLPPSIKSDPQPVIETKTTHNPLIAFHPQKDYTKSPNDPVHPPDPITIKEVKEKPITEIQVDDSANLPKEKIKFDKSATNATAVSLQELVTQNVLLPLDEPQDSINLIQIPVEAKSEALTPENELRIEEIENPQSAIVEEANQEKGLSYILLVGGGIGGVAFFGLLVLAWFLIKEPALPAPSGDVEENKTLPNIIKENPASSLPKPIASAQVSTRTGSSLIMRADKSKESAQVGIIPNEATVEILEYAYYSVLDGDNGRWVYVKYQDKTGWCWGNFLKEIQK